MNDILSASSLVLHGVNGQLFIIPQAMILDDLDTENLIDHA
jgi:hypothetical protein